MIWSSCSLKSQGCLWLMAPTKLAVDCAAFAILIYSVSPFALKALAVAFRHSKRISDKWRLNCNCGLLYEVGSLHNWPRSELAMGAT